MNIVTLEGVANKQEQEEMKAKKAEYMKAYREKNKEKYTTYQRERARKVAQESRAYRELMDIFKNEYDGMYFDETTGSFNFDLLSAVEDVIMQLAYYQVIQFDEDHLPYVLDTQLLEDAWKVENFEKMCQLLGITVYDDGTGIIKPTDFLKEACADMLNGQEVTF